MDRGNRVAGRTGVPTGRPFSRSQQSRSRTDGFSSRVVPGDKPRAPYVVTASFCSSFHNYRRVHYERIGNHPKTRASRSGRPEHGVLFPKSVFILKRRVLINVFHRHDDLLRYQFVRIFDTHTRARAHVYSYACTYVCTYARVHAHARTHTDVVHPSMKCILTWFFS